LDEVDVSRIEFPQKDKNGNFRLEIARADDHYLEKYRNLSFDQINQVLLRNRQQLRHACSVNTQGFFLNAIAVVVLDSTPSSIHLPAPVHKTYKGTLNV